MLPKQSDPRTGFANDGAVRHGGIVVTDRGWRAQDATERAALDLLLACGPLGRAETPGLSVYLGFPWSAFFDSLKHPEVLEAALLRSAWRVLCARERSAGAGVVTVCTHPDLPDHLDRLVAAGVSDVFWTGTEAGAATLPQAPGLRLHPFPALPDPQTESAIGEGPGAAFVICPNGGNHPRLWAAVAAGLIPVLTLAGPLLPGAAALWQAGAVVHDGSDVALAGLAARLATIARDPDLLAAKRRALAGIALLYGPGQVIHDILLCLMQTSDPAGRYMTPPDDGGEYSGGEYSLLGALVPRFRGQARLSAPEARLVLQQATRDLLIGNGGDLARSSGPLGAAAWRLVTTARAALAEDSHALGRFDTVLAQFRARDLLPARIADATAPQARAPALRVFLLGPRGQRTPLAYAPLQRHLAGRVSFVGSAREADLVVTGWNRDLEDNRAELAALWQVGVRPGLVVLSEEPLWDSLWSGDLAPRDRLLDCGGGLQLAYRCLNHVNSDIFRFHTLPWFILSDDAFAARYALLIAPFAALSREALLRHWRAAPLQAAFMAARRMTPDFAACYPVEGVMGLCLYRSRVAELTQGTGVLRIGEGWPGSPVRRQDLPDWHLDKLARLHGRVRLCSAYENTLQACYITEKPFDAFAVGAIPVTLADTGHRLFDLILPEAMMNTRFCPPDVAAARIGTCVPDLTMAEAWLETAQGLLARLRNPGAILAERQRLAEACVAELARFAASAPAQSTP